MRGRNLASYPATLLVPWSIPRLSSNRAAIANALRSPAAQSNQLQRLEAGVAVLAVDDVLVHRNPEWARNDGLRHLDVGTRGRGIRKMELADRECMMSECHCR